jgi:hypothetical protein
MELKIRLVEYIKFMQVRLRGDSVPIWVIEDVEELMLIMENLKYETRR